MLLFQYQNVVKIIDKLYFCREALILFCNPDKIVDPPTLRFKFSYLLTAKDSLF